MARHLARIVVCLDLRVEDALRVQQLLGADKEVIDGRVFSLDIGTSQPSVAMLARHGAAQAVDQVIDPIGNRLQKVDVAWIF